MRVVVGYGPFGAKDTFWSGLERLSLASFTSEEVASPRQLSQDGYILCEDFDEFEAFKKRDSVSFLIGYEDLVSRIARALHEDQDIEEALYEWKSIGSKILDFYKKNRKATLLFNYELACYDILSFYAHISKSLSLGRPRLRVTSFKSHASELEKYLASLLKESYKKEAAMEAQLEACSLPFNLKPSLDDAKLISDYKALSQERTLVKKELILIAEKLAVKEKLDTAELTTIQGQVAKLINQKILHFDKTRSELEEKCKKLEEENKEVSEENELVITQLHQVQEELEKYYLKNKELEQSKAKDSSALKDKEVLALKNELAGKDKKLAELTKSLSSGSKQLEQQVQNLKNELAGKDKKLAELTKSLSTDSSDEKLKEELQDLREENELVITQLHQVQEELERYYLRLKEKEKLSLELEAKLAKQEKLSSKPISLEVKTTRRILRKKIKPLFSTSFYEQASGKKTDPLKHYTDKGWKENLSPHPLFDTRYYVETYKLTELKVSPLEHFVELGYKEGCSPHPLFDVEYYYNEYPDVKANGANPLLHYMQSGWKEGRNPHPDFDSQWYLDQHQDVKETGVNPLLHYVLHGKKEGRPKNPSEAARSNAWM